jgi:hypothetical protein
VRFGSEPGAALLLALAVGCAGADGSEAPPTVTAEPPAAEPEAAPEPEPPAASLSERDGDVRWLTPSASAWQNAPLGQPLRVADQVQTMEDSTATVRMDADGALVDLEPLSVLRIPPQEDARRIRHVSGRIRTRLDPEDGPLRLEINLPPGDLVLTTEPGGDTVESRIEVGEDVTEVAMVQGRGVLRRRGRSVLTIEETEYAQLEADGEILDQGVDLPAPEISAAAREIRTRGDVPFAWGGVEGANGYRVRVTPRAGGEPVDRDSEGLSTSVRLRSGAYTWEVRALDAQGRVGRPSSTAELRVEVDRTPPLLEVVAPRPGVAIETPLVQIAGRTEEGVELVIDGRPVPVHPSGSFATERTIPRGLSNLVIRASDDLGNVRVVTRQVVRSR